MAPGEHGAGPGDPSVDRVVTRGVGIEGVVGVDRVAGVKHTGVEGVGTGECRAAAPGLNWADGIGGE